jgi:hypothetical protein
MWMECVVAGLRAGLYVNLSSNSAMRRLMDSSSIEAVLVVEFGVRAIDELPTDQGTVSKCRTFKASESITVIIAVASMIYELF